MGAADDTLSPNAPPPAWREENGLGVQVVEVPTDARNVHFYSDQAGLPPKYGWHCRKFDKTENSIRVACHCTLSGYGHSRADLFPDAYP